MNFAAVIPARYASTRFPGKPLAMLGGMTVIERVYRRVSEVIDDVWVATDDDRIYNAVAAFGGKAVMTSKEHHSGTDRIQEAVTIIGTEADVIVNVQGDEPFIHPSQIRAVCTCFDDPTVQIATLGKPFGGSAEDMAAIESPNSPKIAVAKDGTALYFSRSVIPYIRGKERQEWPLSYPFLKHLGLYAYRRNVLAEITTLPPGDLEKAESLEQLRWLENGYKVRVGITDIETVGIDTPKDLVKAEAFLRINVKK